MIALINALAVVVIVLLAFAPFILVALLIGHIRANGARRREAERRDQADKFIQAMVENERAARGLPLATVPSARKPWYLR